MNVKLTLPQPLVLQNIKRRKLARVHTLQGKDLDRCARESALWHLRCSLHEQDNWCRTNSGIYGLASLVRQAADVLGEGWGERLEGGADGGAGEGAECLLSCQHSFRRILEV